MVLDWIPAWHVSPNRSRLSLISAWATRAKSSWRPARRVPDRRRSVSVRRPSTTASSCGLGLSTAAGCRPLPVRQDCGHGGDAQASAALGHRQRSLRPPRRPPPRTARLARAGRGAGKVRIRQVARQRVEDAGHGRCGVETGVVAMQQIELGESGHRARPSRCRRAATAGSSQSRPPCPAPRGGTRQMASRAPVRPSRSGGRKPSTTRRPVPHRTTRAASRPAPASPGRRRDGTSRTPVPCTPSGRGQARIEKSPAPALMLAGGKEFPVPKILTQAQVCQLWREGHAFPFDGLARACREEARGLRGPSTMSICGSRSISASSGWTSCEIRGCLTPSKT